jgi:Holliday junction resolvase RusA-like endonuclease
MMPTPVSGNRIWRKGGGRTYEVKQHKDDKTQAALTFRHVPPILGPVAVRVVWVRSRRSGDVDNFAVKPVLDILKGVLFGDDADVVEIRAIRSDDPVRRPGVYVWVFAANADDVAAAGWAA